MTRDKGDARGEYALLVVLVLALIFLCLFFASTFTEQAKAKAETEIEAPQLFRYITPFCSMFYHIEHANPSNYYIMNLGEVVINGLFYTNYQVWRQEGDEWKIYTLGSLPTWGYHAETAVVPGLGWLDHQVIYATSSDPAKYYDKTVCMWTALPLVMK